MTEKYPAPRGLSAAANSRWNAIVSHWDLRPDELRVLEDACREMDLISGLQAVVDEQGMMTTGSMGQPVVHPAVQEVRQHRTVLAALFRQLKLPDEGLDAGARPSDLGAESRSAAARHAAKSRWAVHHGASA